MIVRSPYDPTAVARLRGCGCHAPAQARIVAERTARSSRRRRVRDDSHEAALAGAGADPIVLGAGNGSKCRPFLTVQKDQERFSACNALADKMEEDMIKAGIIDPVKVTRTALQNAASAAAILLTTEAAIAEEPKEDKPEAGGMPGGMGGMDY